MVRVVLVVLLMSFIVVESSAQKRRKQKPVSFQKHYNEVLPKLPQNKINGWHFAPGATYTFGPYVPLKETLSETDALKLQAKYSALGKPGLYAEVGRYRMFKYSKLFKYMDYGVSYKGLRGREKSTQTSFAMPGEVETGSVDFRGDFGYHYAEAFFNLNHVWRISKYNFIQNSIGVNAGYAFIANYSGATASLTPAQPGKINAQLHYKLGFGIKMRGNWLIIPALETPMLNAWPFDNGRSSMAVFGSRYRPLIFSLRFFFIRDANTLDCTPVRTRDGIKMPTDMDKQNEMKEGVR